jgi:hypothetical protein
VNQRRKSHAVSISSKSNLHTSINEVSVVQEDEPKYEKNAYLRFTLNLGQQANLLNSPTSNKELNLNDGSDFSSSGSSKVIQQGDSVMDSLLVDWNKEFQIKLDNLKSAFKNTFLPTKDIHLLRMKAAHELTNVIKDFEFYAETYAKIIISERFIPEGKRTLFPVTSQLKGIAGGEKYIAYGILFKFITGDFSQQLYGSDENAAKSISLDLLGSCKVLECWDSQIRVPMMTTITHR